MARVAAAAAGTSPQAPLDAIRDAVEGGPLDEERTKVANLKEETCPIE
jgi:hypothetical protein